MTVDILRIVGIGGAVYGYVSGVLLGVSGVGLIPIVVWGAIATPLAWWFTPLPNRTLSQAPAGPTDTGAGYWGFERDGD